MFFLIRAEFGNQIYSKHTLVNPHVGFDIVNKIFFGMRSLCPRKAFIKGAHATITSRSPNLKTHTITKSVFCFALCVNKICWNRIEFYGFNLKPLL